MKSLLALLKSSANVRQDADSKTFYQGQAVAVGEDTYASLNMTLDVSNKAFLSITTATSETKAVARSDPGDMVYTDASGAFLSDEADIIIEHTQTSRSAWSDEAGDWSSTVSTTSYFAIDLYWIDLPQKHIQLGSDVTAAAGRSGSGLSGNIADGGASVTARGNGSITDFSLDVFTLEDNMSTVSLSAFASVLAWPSW